MVHENASKYILLDHYAIVNKLKLVFFELNSPTVIS